MIPTRSDLYEVRQRGDGLPCFIVWSQAVVVFLALCSSASESQAQTDDERQRAGTLFEQGLQATRDGDYRRAIDAYDESYRLYAHPGTLQNLALCQDAAGELVAARRSLTELLDQFGGIISPEARERAERRLAETSSSSTGDDGISPMRTDEPAEDSPQSTDEPQRATPQSSDESVSRSDAGSDGGLAISSPPVVTIPRQVDEADAPEDIDEVAPGFDGQSSASQVTASTDEQPREQEERRGRRSFGRGPWPWIIGIVIISAGVASSLAVVLSDNDLEIEPEWWVRLP